MLRILRRSFLLSLFRACIGDVCSLARAFPVISLVLGCGLAHADSGSLPDRESASARGEERRYVLDAFGQLPLSFEVNNGQADPSVRYLARGPGYFVLLAPGEAVLGLDPPLVPNRAAGAGHGPRRSVIRYRFEGARPAPAIAGEDRLPRRSNYFTGGSSGRHLTAVEHYARVRYSQVYDGIDLVFYGNHQQLEYDFVVAPYADPRKIRLVIDGARKISLEDEGDLLLHTDIGVVRQHRPVIYQEIDGRRASVDGRYVLAARNAVAIEVAAYDPGRPLIIDPIVGYSTFLGGKAWEIGFAIAVDAAGSAYVAGYTTSSDFPMKAPYDRTIGNRDAFVTKFNPAGSALVYSTYLGGRNSDDYALGITVDAAGSAYVTGTTTGDEFPTTPGAYQQGVAAGGSFVAKLSPAGDALVYSTYVHNAAVRAIAADGAGGAYITGSAAAGFQATSGAFQPISRSIAGTNAFALKLNPAGSAAAYATFLGGTGTDIGLGIAVDGHGHAYVGGSTDSVDFPLLDAFQSTLRGAREGFVTKLGPAGDALAYSTFLGGKRNDSVNAIAIDSAANVYVTGETYSGDFPVKNAFQPAKPGYLLTNAVTGSAFVTKIRSSGDSLAYSSFLGGEVCTSPCQLGYFGIPITTNPDYMGDVAYSIAVDAAGHAHVTGLVTSFTFPRIDSLLPAITSDNQDAMFVTKVAMAGNVLLYSTLVRSGLKLSKTASPPRDTYLGAGQGIAVDSGGGAYATGASYPDSFSTTAGAFETTGTASVEAIVIKLSTEPVTVSLAALPSAIETPSTSTLTANVAGAPPGGSVTFLDGATQKGTVPVTNGSATLTITPPAGVRSYSAVFRGSGSAADSPTIHQLVEHPLQCD